MYSCYPSISWKLETGGSEVQGHLWLQSDLRPSRATQNIWTTTTKKTPTNLPKPERQTKRITQWARGEQHPSALPLPTTCPHFDSGKLSPSQACECLVWNLDIWVLSGCSWGSQVTVQGHQSKELSPTPSPCQAEDLQRLLGQFQVNLFGMFQL